MDATALSTETPATLAKGTLARQHLLLGLVLYKASTNPEVEWH